MQRNSTLKGKEPISTDEKVLGMPETKTCLQGRHPERDFPSVPANKSGDTTIERKGI
jgi:hypothetical protein